MKKEHIFTGTAPAIGNSMIETKMEKKTTGWVDTPITVTAHGQRTLPKKILPGAMVTNSTSPTKCHLLTKSPSRTTPPPPP